MRFIELITLVTLGLAPACTTSNDVDASPGVDSGGPLIDALLPIPDGPPGTIDAPTIDAPAEIDAPVFPADAHVSFDGSPAPTADAVPATADAAPTGPIAVPNETWTWVPVDGAVCGNGAATGVGVNLTKRSNKVVIVLTAGGACWDYNTCFTLNAATNVSSGYDATDFAGIAQSLYTATIFDRDRSDNPFRDANFIYVPYCTGDLHAGNNVITYTGDQGQLGKVFHVGAGNLIAIVTRMQQTFIAPDAVTIVGVGSGGFGALLNWGRMHDAFPGVPIHVVDDSGPAIAPAFGRYDVWRNAWNLGAPQDCLSCSGGLAPLLSYDLFTYTADHFAGLGDTRDADVATLMGIAADTEDTEVSTYTDNLSTSGGAYFMLAGTGDGLLTSPDNIMAPDGTKLLDWLRQVVTDDPNIKNERP